MKAPRYMQCEDCPSYNIPVQAANCPACGGVNLRPVYERESAAGTVFTAFDSAISVREATPEELTEMDAEEMERRHKEDNRITEVSDEPSVRAFVCSNPDFIRAMDDATLAVWLRKLESSCTTAEVRAMLPNPFTNVPIAPEAPSVKSAARQAYERLSQLLNDSEGIGQEVTSNVGDELDSIRTMLQDALETVREPTPATVPSDAPTVADVLSDTAASSWLKDAIQKNVRRDPVDAANDAETLAAIMRARCEQIA
jgi:hypothetical protein